MVPGRGWRQRVSRIGGANPQGWPRNDAPRGRIDATPRVSRAARPTKEVWRPHGVVNALRVSFAGLCARRDACQRGEQFRETDHSVEAALWLSEHEADGSPFRSRLVAFRYRYRQ